MTELKQLLVVLSLYLRLVFCSDDFFSIVGQRSVRFGKNYEVYLTSTNTSEPFELEVSLLTQKDKEVVKKFKFEVPSPSRKITFDLKDQKSLQNYILTAEIISKNFLKSQNVYVYEGEYSILIQTAKAVYKAGEKVQFRVVVVDHNTKPYLFKKMSVAVTDANKNEVYRLGSARTKNGAFEGSFLLSDEPLPGEWGIHIEIDNSVKPTTKNFEVTDYRLPRFGVILKTKPVVYFSENFLFVKVYAQYTHGRTARYVKGKATLQVLVFKNNLDENNRPVHMTEQTVEGITNKNLQFNLSDLHIEESEASEYFVKLLVAFEDDLTNKKMFAEKVVKVAALNATELIQTESKLHFKPGIPYKVKVILRNQNGKLITSQRNKVQLTVTRYVRPQKPCESHAAQDTFMGGYTQHLQAGVKNGIAEFSIATAREGNALNLIFMYGGSVKSFNVYREPSRSWQYLEAEVQTEKLEINKNVEVEIRGLTEPEYVSAVVIGRTGIIFSDTFLSKNGDSTSFSFTAVADMIPEAALFVYYHERSGEIVHDRVSLKFNEKLPNNLSVQVSKEEVRPGEELKITLNSTANSFVYLRAVDIGSHLLSPNFLRDERKKFMSLLKSPRSDFDRPRNPRYPNFIHSNAFILTNAIKGSLDCTTTRLTEELNEPKGGFQLNDVFKSEDETQPIRKDLSETWIFESFKVGSNGRHEFLRNVPDSMTTYLVQGFSINPTIGLGIAAHKTVSVFKPFFVQVDVPHSIRANEVAKVDVLVFNYKENEKFKEVLVALLNENDDFEFVEIKDDCSISSTSEAFETKRVNSDSKFGVLTTFYIRPKVTGHIKLTIKAYLKPDTDIIERDLFVKHEGVTHFNSQTFLVDLRKQKYFSYYKPLDINDADIIPGSAKVGASIVGNVMGSVLNRNIPDSQGLAQFIANIFFIENTNAIRDLPPDIILSNAELLTAGYQDLIKYKRDDGSFGNIWFTAFAAKCLGHAKHWIEIDDNILRDALSYLSGKQTGSNSFRELGEKKESVALTAYTTIAFLENENYKKEFKSTIDGSVNFLRFNFGDISSNYELAITTYALALNNDPNTDKFLDDLKKNAIIEDKSWHWDLEFNKSRKESETTKAVQVEIASYALLAHLKAGKNERALQILRWLVANSDSDRNSLYAKNTAIVLQALAEASKRFESKSLKLDFELIDSKDKSNKARVDKYGDSEKHVELASYTDSVSIMVNGTGLATLEIWWKYNTKLAQTVKGFDVKVKVEEAVDDRINVQVCTNFIPGINKTRSDVAVMEVELPSGYEFDSEVTKSFEEANVKKFETRDKKTVVVIFLENLSSSKVCLTITAIQVNVVESLNQVPVKVYDLDSPEHRGVQFYGPAKHGKCNV